MGTGNDKGARLVALAAAAGAVIIGSGAIPAARPATGAEPLSFNQHIRPILSENCWACHGPDGSGRKADLRLDLEEPAKAELPKNKGRFAIVPGKPELSEALLRMETAVEDDVMPPPDSHKVLTPAQKQLFRRWIAEGAKWEQHWAFIPPRKADLPAGAAGPVDFFVQRKLAEAGVAPNGPANPRALLRRLSLDLTGLPPTPEESDAFAKDPSAAAYAAAVERLLASPRYGEHMARYWLDAARYADTHGFHFDNYREIWPYRDWVVRAFNRNLPFDQFTIEQLAGDLLPDATLDQKVASGFIRCNPTTNEGGVIPEEYRVKYTFDRVNTFGSIWLGLSVSCAQCHDHRYDPVSQKDYYRLYAFFASTAEPIMDGNKSDTPPVLKVPTPEQQARLDEIAAATTGLDQRMVGPDAALDAQQGAWEAELARRSRADWVVLRPAKVSSEGGSELTIAKDFSVQAGGGEPDLDVYEVEAPLPVGKLSALRLDVLPFKDDGQLKIGRSPNGNFVLSEVQLSFVPDGGGTPVPLTFARATANHSQLTYPVEGAIDRKDGGQNGWGGDGHYWTAERNAVFALAEPWTAPGPGKLRIALRFQSQFAKHAIGRFRLSASETADRVEFALGNWHQLGPFPAAAVEAPRYHNFGPEGKPLDFAAAYGERRWQPVAAAEGVVQQLGTGKQVTYLARTIVALGEASVPVAAGSHDALKIWLNGELVHDRDGKRALVAGSDPLGLNLRAGTNQLLVKVINYEGAAAFVMSTDLEAAGARAEERLVDEDLPARGNRQQAWTFVEAPAPAHSGKKSRLQESAGLVQHYYDSDAGGPLAEAGDTLYGWIYLDPASPPRAVMLQYNTGDWKHRAYWGEKNLIEYAKTDKDEPVYRYMGPLPAAGQWVRLSADIGAVGIAPGLRIQGVAFSQYGGRAWWDDAGLLRVDPLDKLRRVAALTPELRTPEQTRALQRAYRSKALPGFADLEAQAKKLAAEKTEIEKQVPVTLVAAELPKPPPVYYLNRGEYDQKGEVVTAGTPPVLPAFAVDLPSNRLGLARWLFRPDHPLTARVTVNRLWQQFFGVGLVKTTEDFGSQGEIPLYRELLDHLSVDFRESGWDMKKLVRQIVLSDTYRRDARITPAQHARDPENRLLARGPRFRLDAEVIRDQALAVGGLLVEKVGGPPVKPYQPEGLWEAVGYDSSNTRNYRQDKGAALYRRSLYTFWKRTAPPAAMSVLDGPSREFCLTRRERTNTPLAALALMNDITYVEAARGFAERILKEAREDQERLARAFQRATGRPAAPDELAELRGYLDQQRALFKANPERAAKLLATGESPRDVTLDAVDHAAWTMVGSLLLNLDETINKG
jgi:mono/diheme cytochrome c family protein